MANLIPASRALWGTAVLGAVAVVGTAALAVASPAGAAGSGFTAGDVVVYRVGTGAAALSSAATPVSLDEYSPSGSAVQSVELPTAASGSNNPLLASGAVLTCPAARPGRSRTA